MHRATQVLILTTLSHFAQAQSGEAVETTAPLGDRHTELFLGGDHGSLRGVPHIYFPKTTLHLGNLFQGQRVQKVFEFYNKGTAPLHIRSTHASCGCMGVKVIPSQTIAPGERGEVAFGFDSSQFTGHVVRTITLDSDSPNPGQRGGSTQVLTLTANIHPELEVIPPLISLGTVEPEFSAILRFQVKFKALDRGTPGTPPLAQLMAAAPPVFLNRLQSPSRDFKVLGVSTSSPVLEAHWKPSGTQGGSVEIHF